MGWFVCAFTPFTVRTSYSCHHRKLKETYLLLATFFELTYLCSYWCNFFKQAIFLGTDYIPSAEGGKSILEKILDAGADLQKMY